MKVPIETAKQVAKQLQADAVIVIAFRGDTYGTTSYGKDRATCQAFASVCDQVHEDISIGAIPIPEVSRRPSQIEDCASGLDDRRQDNA